MNILLFNYWKDLALDSVEIYFLEIGAYVSLKQAATGVWEGHFCGISMKIPQFFKSKMEEVGPENFTV